MGSLAAPAWQTLHDVARGDLLPARLVLHSAAQLLRAYALEFVPEAADGAHTALYWHPETQEFGTDAADADAPPLFLHPGSLTLRYGTEARLALPGETLEGALEWLGARAGPAGKLEVEPARVPQHELRAGGVFPPADAAHAELARWFHDAHLALNVLAAGNPSWSPVRCWPHHFDIATLLVLDDVGVDPEDARSVGVGLSPGDEDHDDPYWYVNVWPVPASPSLPELPIGRWHTEGWVGAVLDASEVAARDSADQERAVRDFVAAAVEGARSMLAD